MGNPELQQYVNDRLAEGRSQEEVRAILLEHGWSADDVAGVLPAQPAPPALPVEEDIVTIPRRSFIPTLLIILAVLLLGGGGAYAYLSTRKTAGSNTTASPSPSGSGIAIYSGSEVEASFSYPAGWTAKQFVGESVALINASREAEDKEKYPDHIMPGMEVMIAQLDYEDCLEEVIDSSGNLQCQKPAVPHEQQVKELSATTSTTDISGAEGSVGPAVPVTVAGLEGYSVEYILKDGGKGGSITYFLTGTKYMFQLTFVYSGDGGKLATEQKAVLESFSEVR